MDGLHAAAPNLCNICIDRVERGECAGRLYHYYQLQPHRFSSQCEVFRLIDQLCDRLNYPQCSDELRSFSTKTTSPIPQKREKGGTANEQRKTSGTKG